MIYFKVNELVKETNKVIKSPLNLFKIKMPCSIVIHAWYELSCQI